MKKIIVNLGQRSYPIFIGVRLEFLGVYLKKFKFTPKVLVVTNLRVKKLYFVRLKQGLVKAGFKVNLVLMPDGEKYKNFDSLRKIYEQAIKAGLDRRSPIIALGGGVTGDTAGLAAATYLRGLPFIQVPTTLLAMVDSSIGGKTGIDLPEGKNIIGSFYQPRLVWIDLSVLKTLPLRQIRNGLAEVIKYGVIKDQKLFSYLEKLKINKISAREYEKIVVASARNKAQITRQDEKEEKGQREILNFGHTFGHALETLTKYQRYYHGEAVAVGMVFAARLAAAFGLFNDVLRLEKLIQAFGLPFVPKEKFSPDQLIAAMNKDKKVLAGKIRFVLPKKIGQAQVYSNIPKTVLKKALK